MEMSRQAEAQAGGDDRLAGGASWTLRRTKLPELDERDLEQVEEALRSAGRYRRRVRPACRQIASPAALNSSTPSLQAISVWPLGSRCASRCLELGRWIGRLRGPIARSALP